MNCGVKSYTVISSNDDYNNFNVPGVICVRLNLPMNIPKPKISVKVGVGGSILRYIVMCMWTIMHRFTKVKNIFSKC